MVVRVGSTPGGTEKEQREHLPPLQERLFNPPPGEVMQGWGWRGGGGGGATKGGEVAGKASFSLFTCSPLQSLQTLPHPFLIPNGLMETGGVDLFFSTCLLVSDKVEKTQAACVVADL